MLAGTNMEKRAPRCKYLALGASISWVLVTQGVHSTIMLAPASMDLGQVPEYVSFIVQQPAHLPTVTRS